METIKIACSGPSSRDYKMQFKRHCVIIEELLDAGAEDDELGKSSLPDIPDKCEEVILKRGCIYYHDPPSFGLVARIGVRGGCEPH